MPSLDDRFRALERLGPPRRWPELDELEPGAPPPRTPLRRRLGVIALALLVAVAGFVFAFGTFRTDGRSPQPGSPAANTLIAFARYLPEAGLYVMNPDGSGIRRLTHEASNTDPAWSPDGSKIAFTRGFVDEDAGIYVMDADGTDLRRITDEGSLIDGADLGPAWSPDGSRIAFAREGREEGAESGSADIYVVNADGTNLVRLTATPANEYEPDWSPDGSTIAFVGFDDPPSPFRLYVMNADGTGIRELGPANVQGPAWSPDGSEIAYADYQTGSIMSIRPDGSGQRLILDVAELVGGVHLVDDVTWSPDGTRLAFMAGPNDADTHIYIVNRDGSNVQQVTDDRAPDWAPAWQPAHVPEPSAAPARSDR
jgi:TolB protein